MAHRQLTQFWPRRRRIYRKSHMRRCIMKMHAVTIYCFAILKQRIRILVNENSKYDFASLLFPGKNWWYWYCSAHMGWDPALSPKRAHEIGYFLLNVMGPFWPQISTVRGRRMRENEKRCSQWKKAGVNPSWLLLSLVKGRKERDSETPESKWDEPATYNQATLLLTKNQTEE